MKKKYCSSLLCVLMLCLTSLGLFCNNVSANENIGCIVTKDDKIICIEDVPEGCEIDFENNEIICPCPIEPLENHCQTCKPKD